MTAPKTHEVVRRVAYDGPCPRCGGPLSAPDEQQDRRCFICVLRVEAAVEWWTIEDGAP